jgi:hypothetical protein
MRRYLIILPFLVLVAEAKAQLNNDYLFNKIRPADSLTKELRLDISSFNYVRNYEYTNRFHDGYTLYGTQLEPTLTYYAHPNLSITAGAILRKDFGDNTGLRDSKMLFNIKYSKKDLTLVFGSLEGNIQHRYIEPIYNFERKITTPVEYGTQLIIDKEDFYLDTWIAWQKMIYKGDAAKEEIVGGLHGDAVFFDKNNWKLTIPAQMLMYHQGGQIDVLNNIGVSTLFNGAIGLDLSKKVKGSVKKVYTKNYVVGYKDMSPTKVRPYQGGFGVWLNAGLEASWGNLSASYWKANQFITIKGMPLYQSVSENINHIGYQEDKRHLLTLRYQYLKVLLPNLYLDVRLEPHFDLNHADKQLQFSHSFFLTYKENFKLFKAKK